MKQTSVLLVIKVQFLAYSRADSNICRDIFVRLATSNMEAAALFYACCGKHSISLLHMTHFNKCTDHSTVTKMHKNIFWRLFCCSINPCFYKYNDAISLKRKTRSQQRLNGTKTVNDNN